MAEDTMLQEAIEALRRGERARARDILTRQLKADQQNIEYWLWLSTAVETQKERIYCLQTVLQFDPKNVAAKRGLVLMGALAPDDSIKPFPMNHPRPWEPKLVLAEEKEKPKGFKALTGNPVFRLASILLIGAILLSGAFFGFNRLRRFIPILGRHTPPPTWTWTPAGPPSATPLFRTPTPTFAGPTPLIYLLSATYTPTPIYVNTPHPGAEAYRAGIRYFNNGDYTNAIGLLQQVLTPEPAAADVYYYIGESYRLSDNYQKAFDMYQNGIEANALFAPNFLGRARVRAHFDPSTDVTDDLNAAIALDPNFVDAFLERASYYLRNSQPQRALSDLQKAEALAPGSPQVYLSLAKLNLALGNNADALAEAQKANELDITILETYFVLGKAYQANDQLDQAVGAMQTYTLYAPNDVDALVTLAAAYDANKDYEHALATANKALGLDDTASLGYLARGLANLGLGDNYQAYRDLDYAFKLNKKSFEAGLGAGQALLLLGEPGNAYIQIAQVEGLIANDNQRARFLYYRALALEGVGEKGIAARDWQSLLLLPEDVMNSEMRADAEKHFYAIRTATPTSTPTKTPKPTKTPIPTRTRIPSPTTAPTATP
jgi:tetratricopeptide (TPR) repeat protein